ncbi:hypothetical protein LTR35_017322 [Friedmanniomyces endolithicus]|nr:hypothetical protein LTR35_017322 [Friedmanniomyces endolithicus]KAK0823056.1 hypothetical protein LTR73_008823 [Friedmanniomyces endolithicus]KAK0974379.1 hypothetical protein LTR54_017109 [Friedmanniomyces endolithicus]
MFVAISLPPCRQIAAVQISSEQPPQPATAARSSRCVSIPFGTVDAYTKREFEAKLSKPFWVNTDAHPAAVTGRGGTGYSQLMLRFIDEHKAEYDTILRIDARSEEMAQSSYERCCRALRLRVQPVSSVGSVQDALAVQAVLQWLRNRGQEERWLTVVDNADDLSSWDVSSIVPRGRTGTIVVTSQDARATRLLGGRSDTGKVDDVEPEEAVQLLFSFVDEPLLGWGDEFRRLVDGLTGSLDRLPPAVDMAVVRIRIDVEDGDGVEAALRQYVADYCHYRDRLLQSEDFTEASSYKETVWTVWETGLLSLRELENRQSDIRPTRLLSFLTFLILDCANVQDELFRLASLGLPESCRELNATTPTWMQALLATGDSGGWDDYIYRVTVKTLLRYGLVRLLRGPWKGTTMHSLVRWRAGVELDADEYQEWYAVFTAAVCAQFAKELDKEHFWRHVGVQEHADTLTVMGKLAETHDEQGRWKEAEELEVKVIKASSRLLGEEHPITLSAMGNLDRTYRNQRWTEADEVEGKVMQAMSRVLGEEHPNTLTAMASLAATYYKQARWEEVAKLQFQVIEAS